MEIRTNIQKLGTSNYFLIPSSIIKVYNLLHFTKKYEYKISVELEGKRIVFDRVKKQYDTRQTTLSDKQTIETNQNQTFNALKGGLIENSRHK